MSDTLRRICADKRQLVTDRKAARPFDAVERDAKAAAAPSRMPETSPATVSAAPALTWP